MTATKRTYTLPDGTRTTNANKFCSEWEKFWEPIEEVAGLSVYGYNDDASSTWYPSASARLSKATKKSRFPRSLGDCTVSMPGWLVRRLRQICLEVQQSRYDATVTHLDVFEHQSDPEKEADRMIADSRQRDTEERAIMAKVKAKIRNRLKGKRSR